MIVELRIYHYLLGILPALLERFRSTTLDYFSQYRIEQIGFLTTQVGYPYSDVSIALGERGRT